MTADADRWGVPKFSATVVRSRLLERFLSPDRVVFIVAAAGYGKTILAAQYADTHVGPVIWLSLRGQPANESDILRLATGLLSSSSESPVQAGEKSAGTGAAHQLRNLLASKGLSNVALILDDFSASAGESASHVCAGLSKKLGPFVTRVVVTSRDTNDEGLVRLESAALVDRHDLAFDPDETRSLLRVLGREWDADFELDDVRVSCAGHAALLSLTIAGLFAEHAGGDEPPLAVQAIVERLISAHFSGQDRRALEIASLLKEGSLAEVEEVGVAGTRAALERVARILPLVRIENGGPSQQLIFTVHNLVGDCVLHSLAKSAELWTELEIQQVLGLLTGRGDWIRCTVVLRYLGTDSDLADFVESYGDRMIEDQQSTLLLQLLNKVALRQVMFRSKCLLHWARALHEIGEVEESIAKATAAVRLAGHDSDYETLGLAVAQRAQALLDQGKAHEAVESAEQTMRDHLGRMSPLVRCELLICVGNALGVLERREDASRLFSLAEQAALADRSNSGPLLFRLRMTRAYLHPLWEGDFARGVAETGPLLNDRRSTFLVRRSLRGNLAWMLMETGRLARAESLLTHVLEPENDVLEASFLPVAALIRAARGDLADALQLLERSQVAAVAYEDEANLQVNRIYEACVRRAYGQVEAALDLAERSFEGLSRHDFLGYSRLAASEIACSFLALGDTAGARAWLGDEVVAWRHVNRYHALAGAMVLAVADFREGLIEQAVARLTPLSDYIRSDSANWRMAMDCRTFPELLGLLALAAGADGLPVHMLRMVLPENVERSLRVAVDFMPSQEWTVLGRRALGEEQFQAYLDRKGRPICRVHLFGGLDVIAGDRAVTEKDWRKRKARLLFAMLVVRQGQEIARDQILDHLWGDLTEEKAKNNFYVAWSTMKAALQSPEERGGPCPYIESSRGRCRIVRDSVRSDVDEFEELLAESRKAEAGGRVDEAVAALQQLMSVYRGDLLPGDVYDDWFAPLRDKYRFEFIDAMVHGAELLLEAGDPGEALLFARRAISVDRSREDLYQIALQCHLAAGQRGAAIETFIQCKTQLVEQLGLDPSAETMALYQQILSMEDRATYDSYGLT